VNRYLLFEIRNRLGRTITTVLGVAIGVALFIALTAAGQGFREAARRPLAGVGADIVLTHPAAGNETAADAQTTRGVRLPFGVSTFMLGDLGKVQKIQSVDMVAGALLLWDFGATSYQTVLGVDVNQAAVGPARASEWITAGRFLQFDDTRVAVVDQHYAAFFHLKPGGAVNIGDEPFRVIGIVQVQEGSQVAAANFYIPLADAQMLAHLTPDAINEIYVRVGQASAVDDVVQRSRAALGEVSATTEQSIVQVMGSIASVSERFASIASLVALLGGLALTGLALSASVTERRREIGVMKAVGWTLRDVRNYFIGEGLALSLLGAFIGILLGWLSTLVLGMLPIDVAVNSSVPQGLASASAMSSTLTLPARLTLAPVILALGAALVGGAMASWFIARRAAILKPAEALRQ
jgi:putative ABC transport system permease protein